MSTDHAFEALVEVTVADVQQQRGELNRALFVMRESTKDLDLSNEELAIMIRHRAGLYREVMPEVLMTPSALGKWWNRIEAEHARLHAVADRVEAERNPRKGVNLFADSGCTTCLGQHYVIVGYREPRPTQLMIELGIKHKQHPKDRGYEEVAPCPLCNDRQGWWQGRTWTYGTEPGELVLDV